MFKNFRAAFRNAYGHWNPPMVILLFIFPIGLCLGILSLFSEETPSRLEIGIVAESGGDLQGKILRAIDATQATRLVKRCKSVSECASAMRGGEIYAFLHLPEDLEKNAHRLETPVVTVYTNGQSLLTSKLITNDLRTAIGTQGAILVKNAVLPPITTELHIVGNPTGNYERFLGIGLVTAFFHVIAMIFGAYIFAYPIREKRTGEWFAAAGNSTAIAFFGRFLPALAILGTEMVFLLFIARKGMPALQGIDIAVLVCGAYAMVGTCLAAGATFVGFVGEMRIALSSAAVAGGPAFAFCGQTFPLFAMPFGLRAWAFILPITHFMQLESAFFLGHIGVARAFHSLEILCGELLFWILLAIFTLRIRIPKTIEREKAAL